MKQAAQKSYGKKGQDVVEMNWKAIDAGVDAIHKVDVPASWSNPEADPAPKALTGRPELVKQIRDVMEPIARMDGDSLPVSAFVANANGEWEQGAICIREARHRCERSRVGCFQVRRLQPVCIRLLSCYHPSLPADR